jgi:hypothetical protein
VVTAVITIAVGSAVDLKSFSIMANWAVEATSVGKIPAIAVAQQT